MDLFWITRGGQRPVDYFRRTPGRFRLCHVKDGQTSGMMTDVGAGTINFAAIFAQRETAGLRHFFVEHDNPKNPMTTITASYQYLRGLTF